VRRVLVTDAVVLLSAPAHVLLARIDGRTTNDYGKSAADRALILWHRAEVEPRLRATCTHELDAAQPIEDVVARSCGSARIPAGRPYLPLRSISSIRYSSGSRTKHSREPPSRTR
jgi:hypothetical protein